jgi:hypothetical protein
MGEVLKEHFEIAEDEGGEAISAKLAGHADLGLTLGIASADELHPLVARERLQDAWVEFLDELARDRPVVMLIEDVHWAEDQLCDLIDTLVARVSGPLLVLATARLEMLDRRPAWGGAWGRTSAIRLDALPSADTSRMLDQLLGAEIPADIGSLVVERAEGNPFFVEELIATFIDRGVLQRQNGAWSFTRLPDGFSVPDSVQAVLAARIDLLPDSERAALQAAAVIGRTFWTGPMYALVGGQRPNVGVLEEREFVRRNPGSSLPGEREYVIKHALTREVAYRSIPRARRAHMHAAFAAWLDRQSDGRDELAPLLAHHYATAVRPEDLDLAWAGQEGEVQRLRANAIAWSRRAAELAIGRYEIDDGIALLRRAAELEPEPTQQADLWYAIGHASALKYDGEAFVGALERALELGAPAGEVYAELAYQTAQRAGMWQRRLDTSLVEGWIERALAGSVEGTPASVRALVASSLWYSDLEAARAALAVAERLGDVELRFEGLAALQNALQENGQFLEACGVAAERSERVPDIADPDQVADAFFMNADLYVNVGRLADARAMTERMEEQVAGLTPHHRVHALGMRLRLERAMGDWEAVCELTRRTEDAIEANLATPCPFNVGLPILLATAWIYSNQRAESDRLIARAEAIGMVGYAMMHAPQWLGLAMARRDHAEIRRLIESVDPAWLTPGAWELWAAVLDGLVEIDDRDRIEADAPPWVRPDAYVAPFAVRALGMARRDNALVADAVTRFEAMGLDWHAQQTRARLVRN